MAPSPKNYRWGPESVKMQNFHPAMEETRAMGFTNTRSNKRRQFHYYHKR